MLRVFKIYQNKILQNDFGLIFAVDMCHTLEKQENLINSSNISIALLVFKISL